MKVLVLGGAGYIGSALCPYLDESGDEVIVLDNLLYKPENKLNYKIQLIKGDVRDTRLLHSLVKGVDAVVNLAALSNDPLSDLDPSLTWEINYEANRTIAKICQQLGKRVVFASSCSVYGFSEDGVFDETSGTGPVTLYAKTKILSESFYSNPKLDAVILRFATVYGYAPKARFDLVVNTMSGTAYFENKIVVNGGEQWRPLVHVKDVARAIFLGLHTSVHKHRVYNVGTNEQNFQIKDLGRLIVASMPKKVELIESASSVDARSYKVDFSRIKSSLGFEAKYNIPEAVKELHEAFERREVGSLIDDVYYRIKYLKSHYHSDLKSRHWLTSLKFKLSNLFL